MKGHGKAVSDNSKAIVIRAGGLGDFIVTIPFLKTLETIYEEVILATRRPYWDLIRHEGIVHRFVDIDTSSFSGLFGGPEAGLASLFHDAHVYSFWQDPGGILTAAALGAARWVQLESRPVAPPHVTRRMFDQAGISPPDDLLTRAWLGGSTLGGSRLWLHPGSGSAKKNAPLAWFAARADAWLREDPGVEIIVSIGEAEKTLLEPIRDAFASLPVTLVVEPTLVTLRERIMAEAALFVGNDSGVTHLAASLGVPVEVVFKDTEPAIWRPLGPFVHVLDWSEQLFDWRTEYYGIA